METLHLTNYQRNRFPLSAFRTDSHTNHPPHSHDFTELILVFAGMGIHVGIDGKYSFKGGDVFVIEPGAIHSYRAIEGVSLVNIMYDAKRLYLPEHYFRQLPGYHALFHLEPRVKHKKGSSNLRLNEADLKRVEVLTGSLLHELKQRPTGYEAMSVAILIELIVFLSRRVEGTTDTRWQNVQTIGKALSHIEKHFAEQLTLEDFARQAGMSVRNFQRRFKEAVGVTPFQRLLEIRIDRAKALLQAPELSITEIAFLIGFQDSNYFCRQFRKLEGVSPSKYRSFSQNG